MARAYSSVVCFLNIVYWFELGPPGGVGETRGCARLCGAANEVWHTAAPTADGTRRGRRGRGRGGMAQLLLEHMVFAV